MIPLSFADEYFYFVTNLCGTTRVDRAQFAVCHGWNGKPESFYELLRQGRSKVEIPSLGVRAVTLLGKEDSLADRVERYLQERHFIFVHLVTEGRLSPSTYKAMISVSTSPLDFLSDHEKERLAEEMMRGRVSEEGLSFTVGVAFFQLEELGKSC